MSQNPSVGVLPDSMRDSHPRACAPSIREFCAAAAWIACLTAGCAGTEEASDPSADQDAGSGGRVDSTVGGGGSGGAATSTGGTAAASGGTPGSGGTIAGTGGVVDTDSGAAGDSGAAFDASPESDAAPRGTPTIVAVGYAGLRVASYDRGRTWVNKRTLSNVAADDNDNLRGVAYAAGLFVAVGHKLFTSIDGDTWERRTHPHDDGQWLAGIQYGNGRFVATGGYGYTAWSADGIEWNLGDFLEGEASRSLAFGDGTFMTQTDPGNWWRSTDGESWEVDSGGHSEHVAFCDGAFREDTECPPVSGHGVFVRDGGWDSGVIEWSEDGENWNDVDVGYVGGINAFAFGYAP